jgi:glutathione peroxidase
MNFGITFPQFKKIDVNGDNAIPLYKFLKEQKKGLLGSKIKWNFTKFLVDSNGNVIKRFASNIEPKNIEKDIVRLLK